MRSSVIAPESGAVWGEWSRLSERAWRPTRPPPERSVARTDRRSWPVTAPRSACCAICSTPTEAACAARREASSPIRVYGENGVLASIPHVGVHTLRRARRTPRTTPPDLSDTSCIRAAGSSNTIRTMKALVRFNERTEPEAQTCAIPSGPPRCRRTGVIPLAGMVQSGHIPKTRRFQSTSRRQTLQSFARPPSDGAGAPPDPHPPKGVFGISDRRLRARRRATYCDASVSSSASASLRSCSSSEWRGIQ
jgi:hypothetical protein